ncbi:MAG: potassium channel protein [Alphaproteobacteria bacterium]|nr:potassium channel protein [Alphaproteobacteria bacterium]
MPSVPPDPLRLVTQRALRAIGLFGGVVGVGVVGYLWLGQGRWTAGDALYMSVITLSTVGYGETLAGMDEVPGARGFTMALILCGTGTLLYLTSALTAFVVEGDLQGGLRRRIMSRRIEAMHGHTVLVGLGATGSHVATELRETGREFVVVERNPEKVDRVREEWQGIEPLYIIGDATDEDVLRRAGLERADGLIAALTDDRDNLFVVFTARAMKPELRIIAKTVDPQNRAKMERAGADAVVSPALIGGTRMVSAMLRPYEVGFFDEMMRDHADPHRIVEIEIPNGSPAIGKTLNEAGVRMHSDALVMAVRDRHGHLRYNPSAGFVIESGLTLVVLVRAADCSALREDLGAQPRPSV